MDGGLYLEEIAVKSTVWDRVELISRMKCIARSGVGAQRCPAHMRVGRLLRFDSAIVSPALVLFLLGLSVDCD